MMAQFIEEGSNEVTQEEVQELDQPIEQEQQQEVVQQQEQVDEIPEKYKGKDLKEIIRMHSEAEKLIGRQGSEVGELRKIVDDFIKAQTVNAVQPQEDINEDDFFADPKAAVAKAIENHPKVRQAEVAAAEMAKAKILQNLQSKHPDFLSVVQDGSFQDWVKASKVRSELFFRADKQFDFDAADELLSTWKDRQGVAKQTVSAEKQARSQAIKSASTAVSGGSDEAPSKKIYRRADIIRLMQTDSDKYDMMQDEILAAYREGRVR
jgi:predicted RNA-binding protein YlqC (UPF0109 family)